MLLKGTTPPPNPATQLVVQIERNTLRGARRGQGTHHTGEGEGEGGLEQKGSAVQGGRRRAKGSVVQARLALTGGGVSGGSGPGGQ